MKKWIIRLASGMVVLVILIVTAIGLFLDSGIKKGIETFGPKLTKVSVKLDGVSLSVLSGSGSIKGLEVGNPEGYKAPTAIKLGRANLAVKPSTLMFDKMVVKSIRLEAPEINIEGSPTKNNLTKIRDNVQGTTSGGTGTPAKGANEPGKKLEVDEFVLTGAKVSYTVPGVGITVPIAVPEIRLANLGTGPEGITAGELTSLMLSKLTTDLVPLLTAEVSKAGTQAVNAAADAGKQAAGDAGKAVKSVTDIFNKK
jgi:uncharacterized protein involved in outer membrane biogenesis